MKYGTMMPGVFLARPNRFIAHVEIAGQAEICHVKNTGRCRELLPQGAAVWCEPSSNPARKTKFDLIAVQKGQRLINMDSQAPNTAAKEWLLKGGLGAIQNLKTEVFHGDSRFDFAFELSGQSCFLEVKGVTLENNGICTFPDAPTERGVKHVLELVKAKQEGYMAYVLFIVQMEGMKLFMPNDDTHEAFGDALRYAAAKGVEVMAYQCHVTEDSMEASSPLEVRLQTKLSNLTESG